MADRTVQRGEIWIADLGYAGKIRPVLIISAPPTDRERALHIVMARTTTLWITQYEGAIPHTNAYPGDTKTTLFERDEPGAGVTECAGADGVGHRDDPVRGVVLAEGDLASHQERDCFPPLRKGDFSGPKASPCTLQHVRIHGNLFTLNQFLWSDHDLTIG